MTAPLSAQKKGALWRAYKVRPSANYVARTCKVSPHTAEKYIRELNFKQRLKNLQERANQLIPEDEAKRYAEIAGKVRELSRTVLDELIELYRSKALMPSAKDADLFIRLDAFLHGGPESRTQHDLSIDWLFKDEQEESRSEETEGDEEEAEDDSNRPP